MYDADRLFFGVTFQSSFASVALLLIVCCTGCPSSWPRVVRKKFSSARRWHSALPSINAWLAASVGVLFSTLYALKFIQRAYHGPNTHHWAIPDLAPREALIYVPMILVLVWLGVYPQPIIRTFQPAMQAIQQSANKTREEPRQ